MSSWVCLYQGVCGDCDSRRTSADSESSHLISSKKIKTSVQHANRFAPQQGDAMVPQGRSRSEENEVVCGSQPQHVSQMDTRVILLTWPPKRVPASLMLFDSHAEVAYSE